MVGNYKDSYCFAGASGGVAVGALSFLSSSTRGAPRKFGIREWNNATHEKKDELSPILRHEMNRCAGDAAVVVVAVLFCLHCGHESCKVRGFARSPSFKKVVGANGWDRQRCLMFNDDGVQLLQTHRKGGQRHRDIFGWDVLFSPWMAWMEIYISLRRRR